MSHRPLILLLRLSGVVLLTALVPAAMPFAWMQATNAAIGLGDLPYTPLTHYLTRSLSLLYAFHGGLLLCLSFDTPRYLPLIRLTAFLTLLFSLGILLIDLTAPMPTPWLIGEPACIAVLALLLLGASGSTPPANRSHALPTPKTSARCPTNAGGTETSAGQQPPAATK